MYFCWSRGRPQSGSWKDPSPPIGVVAEHSSDLLDSLWAPSSPRRAPPQSTDRGSMMAQVHALIMITSGSTPPYLSHDAFKGPQCHICHIGRHFVVNPTIAALVHGTFQSRVRAPTRPAREANPHSMCCATPHLWSETGRDRQFFSLFSQSRLTYFILTELGLILVDLRSESMPPAVWRGS